VFEEFITATLTKAALVGFEAVSLMAACRWSRVTPTVIIS
jgi:hypothetical protein